MLIIWLYTISNRDKFIFLSLICSERGEKTGERGQKEGQVGKKFDLVLLWYIIDLYITSPHGRHFFYAKRQRSE